jgi:hypothetical protein
MLVPPVGGSARHRARVLRHVTNCSGRALFWYSNGGVAPRVGQASRLAGREIDRDVEPMRLGVEVGAADGPGRGQGRRRLQQRCVSHAGAAVTLPILFEPEDGGSHPQGRLRAARRWPKGHP